MRDIKGFGLGARPAHYQTLLDTEPKPVDWLEILTENYLVPGGQVLYYLDKLTERYPIVMHGVSLSIGGTDALNWNYLQALKQLSERCHAVWVSDHLCWTGIGGINTHDLLPVPLTEESLNHCVGRLQSIQDYLGRAILIENPSSYIAYGQDELTEWDFLTELVRQTGCSLLLDINNVYVSSVNHQFCAKTYIEALPTEAVKQIHLAGHTVTDSAIIDTHDAAICDAVLDLYRYAITYHGFVPTMIERDDNIPPLAELLLELELVKKMAYSVTNQSDQSDWRQRA